MAALPFLPYFMSDQPGQQTGIYFSKIVLTNSLNFRDNSFLFPVSKDSCFIISSAFL